MKVSEEVFACWTKACAPPPAGKGGSMKGGAHSLKTRNKRDNAYRRQKVKELAKRAQSAHSTSGAKYGMGKPGEHSPGPSARVKALTDKFGTRQRGASAPKAKSSELRRGGTETLKGMGSWNGGKLGRYKNGQYYVKPPGQSPIPLAARSKDKAYEEISKRK